MNGDLSPNKIDGSDSHKSRFPVWPIMLDVIGTLVLAMCYPEHQPSRRVLEKGGFEFEGTFRRFSEFPNLHPGVAEDVVSYAWIAPDHSSLAARENN